MPGRSIEYNGFCLDVDKNSGQPFRAKLAKCDDDSSSQQWTYNENVCKFQAY